MREIGYSINSQATFETDYLVLDLLELIKEGPFYRIHSFLDSSTTANLRHLVKNTTLFNFLLKEEQGYLQQILKKNLPVDSLQLKHFHISSSQVHKAFQLLSESEKLFCQNKQLSIDLVGQAEFCYLAKPTGDGKLEIKGRLRWRDKVLCLSECDAIGPGKPLWFVKGHILKFISTSIKWKMVQELKRGSILLEGRAKQSFLEDLDPEDPEMPKLVVKEGSIEEIFQQNSPYPILQLKDRWGACADLMMDYGNGQIVAFHDPHPMFKDEKGYLSTRQRQAECHWENDLLETDFKQKAVSSSHYYCPLDKIAKSLTFLLEMGWKIIDWQKRQVIRQTDLTIELVDRAENIGIKGQVSYDNHKVDIKGVLGAFNRRETFIELSHNTVGLMSKDSYQQCLHNISEECEWVGHDEVFIKKNRFGNLQPLWDRASYSDSLCDLKNKLENFSGLQETLPAITFQGKLRPYQQLGVNWLSFLHEYGFHGILADEMGLGKTVQILAFLSQLPVKGPHLIVMPTSLLFNWRNEINDFLPSSSLVIHQGSNRCQSVSELEKVDIILTSYTTLRIDLPLLQKINYYCLILDEAQMIKNANNQTTQAVCQISARLRLSLTGTPIENHLNELWSQFHFLMPALFGSQESFVGDTQAAQADYRYLERIRRKIAPFILRRRKNDVARDLPPRIEQVAWIEMEEEQRTLYDQTVSGFKSGLLKKVELDGLGKHRLEVLEAILRLRQICCHPLLISSIQEDPIQSSAKYQALFHDLEALIENGQKVLIYSQFTSMLKLMAKDAQERQWSFCYLDGTTKNREDVVRRFQEDSSQFLFFISLKAGGVGLNLTAADYVYLYDPWWNVAVEEQAINRAHRIGRERPVVAKRLVIRESIEEKMMKIKSAKSDMIDDLINHETHFSDQLTLDDFRILLS